MISLGNFIALSVFIIIYTIWSYHSIKDWIKCWNKRKDHDIITIFWNFFTAYSLAILFIILTNYLNQYKIF